MDTREAVRSRLELKQVIERYVALRPAGKGRWKGLCPFHKERTPSFHVDEAKELYYCFGCKAGGDVFNFVQRIEGIEFQEALLRLAAEVGVEVEHAPHKAKERHDLLGINKLALAFFREHLLGEPLSYLKRRGLEQASLEPYALGYAPPGWDNLLSFLKKKGVDEPQASVAGLVVERDGRYYDRFRNRLIFPIHDHMGRVVAFTGRVLDKNDTPKYLNIPETSLFKKSELLYGLHQARGHVREKQRAVVVEGLFDVIALAQMGYPETVAVLGSSLSADQSLLLKRADVKTIYLAFDADNAGREATLKGLELDIARGFMVFAVKLPEGSDPGDLLLSQGGAGMFEQALTEALPEVEYRYRVAAIGIDITKVEGKRQVLNTLLPRLITPEPYDPVAEALKERLVSRLGLDARQLNDLIVTARKRRRPGVDAVQFRGLSQEYGNKVLLLELDLLALVLSGREEELAHWLRYIQDHTWPPEGSFLAEACSVAAAIQYSSRRLVASFESRSEGARLFERLMLQTGDTPDNLEHTLDKAMARLREAYLQVRLNDMKEVLKEQLEPDTSYLREVQDVQRAIEAERRLYKLR